MIYTKKTQQAMKFAYEKHHGQVDKSGVPYIFHPYHVAEQMDDENSTIVALLHDVIEDTDTTIEDLNKMKFNSLVIEALKLLTHDKNIEYEDYIKKIKGNPLATKVKIADLEHNLDITRLGSNMTEKYVEKSEKYRWALDYLTLKKDS